MMAESFFFRHDVRRSEAAAGLKNPVKLLDLAEAYGILDPKDGSMGYRNLTPGSRQILECLHLRKDIWTISQVNGFPCPCVRIVLSQRGAMDVSQQSFQHETNASMSLSP